MPAKKWILFDIGGVLELVDDDTWQQQWWSRVQERSGLDDVPFEQAVGAAGLPAIDVEEGTEAEFWSLLGAAVGIGAAGMAEVRADFWDAYCGELNTELFDFARSLRGRAGLAILSNSADGARTEEQRRFGFADVFDPICYSHEQGVNKPEERAYLFALERMGASPADVFFIDDHQAALDGAAAVGIRGILHTENAVTIAAIEEFLAA